MTQLLVTLLVVLTCWFIGTGVLAWARKSDKLLPGALAMVIGFGVWVLVLEFTRLLPGYKWPLVVGLIAAVCAAVVACIRLAREGGLAELAASTVPGLIAGVVVSIYFVMPWLLDSSLGGVLHFTSNHDAYHFSSGAQWFVGHSSLDPPIITAMPGPDSSGPAYSAARGTLVTPLRDGFELVFASILSVTGLSAYEVWPAFAAAMGGLIASASTGLASFVRSGRILAIFAGIATGICALSSFQIANQNGASMAGIAIAIAILLLWMTVMGDSLRELHGKALVILGVALAALVAVYWEGIPSIALALILATLVYGRRVGYPLMLRRLVVVGAVAAATGAVGAWIAVRSAITLSTLNPPGWKSPFSENPITYGIAWIFGTARYRGAETAFEPSQGAILLGLVFLVLALIGIAATLFVPRVWPVSVGFFLAFGGGWVWWGYLSPNGYTHRRFVEFAAVILVAIVIAGWVAIPGLRARKPSQAIDEGIAQTIDGDVVAPETTPARTGRWIAVPVLFLAFTLVVSSAASARVLNASTARGHLVNYQAVADMLSSRDGSVLVVAPELVNQAWIGLALADRPDTQYLVPCSCLVGMTMEPYLTGERPSWILLQRNAGTVKGDASVVASSGKLDLYQVGLGRVAVEAKNLQGETKKIVYPSESKAETR